MSAFEEGFDVGVQQPLLDQVVVQRGPFKSQTVPSVSSLSPKDVSFVYTLQAMAAQLFILKLLFLFTFALSAAAFGMAVYATGWIHTDGVSQFTSSHEFISLKADVGMLQQNVSTTRDDLDDVNTIVVYSKMSNAELYNLIQTELQTNLTHLQTDVQALTRTVDALQVNETLTQTQVVALTVSLTGVITAETQFRTELQTLFTQVGGLQNTTLAHDLQLETLERLFNQSQSHLDSLTTLVQALQGNLTANVALSLQDFETLVLQVHSIQTNLTRDYTLFESQVIGLPLSLSTLNQTFSLEVLRLAGQVNVTHTQFIQLSQSLTDVLTIEVSLQTQVNALGIQMGTLQMEVNDLILVFPMIETQIATLDTQVSGLDTQVETLVYAETLLNASLLDVSGAVPTLQGTLSTLQTDVNSLILVFPGLETSLTTLQTELTQLQTRLGELEANVESETLNETEFRQVYQEINATVSTLQHEVEGLSLFQTQALLNFSALHAFEVTTTTQLATLEAEVTAIQSFDSLTATELSLLQTQMAAVQASLASTTTQLGVLNDVLFTLEGVLAAHNNTDASTFASIYGNLSMLLTEVTQLNALTFVNGNLSQVVLLELEQDLLAFTSNVTLSFAQVHVSILTLLSQQTLQGEESRALNASLVATQTQVTSLIADLSTLATLTSDLATASTSIARLQLQVNGLVSNVTTLQSLEAADAIAIGLLQNTVTQLQGFDIAVASNVSLLQSIDATQTATLAFLSLTQFQCPSSCQLPGLQANISTLQALETSLNTQVGGLLAFEATAETNIATLQGQVASIQAFDAIVANNISLIQAYDALSALEIALLQSQMSSAQSGIVTLTTQMTSLNQTILTLQGTVTTDQNYNLLQFMYVYGNLSSLQLQLNGLNVLLTQLQTQEAVTNANVQTLNTTVYTWMATFNIQFTSLQASLTTLTLTVSTQETQLVALNASLLATQAQVNTLLPLLSSVAVLQTNITSLSNSIASLTGSVTALQTVDATQNTNIATLQASQTTQNQQLANLQTNVTTLSASVAAIQLVDATQTLNIAALQVERTADLVLINGLQTQVTILQTNVSTIALFDTMIFSNVTRLFALNNVNLASISAIQGVDTSLQTQITANLASINGLQTQVTTNLGYMNTNDTSLLSKINQNYVTLLADMVIPTSQYYSKTTQTPTSTTSVGFEVSPITGGAVSKVGNTNTRFTILETGNYTISYNLLVTGTSGTVTIFYAAVNGVDIPGSASAMTFTFGGGLAGATLTLFENLSNQFQWTFNAGDSLGIFTDCASGCPAMTDSGAATTPAGETIASLSIIGPYPI